MANPPEETTTTGGWKWFKSFQYNKEKVSPNDVRNVLLVVAALITAVTFQAGVNPPGGVWQDSKDNHTAGTAIYASQQYAFYVFLISNSLALSSSLLVITSLTYGFPFRFEIWVATVSMIITYGSSVFAVTPRQSVKFRYVLSAAAVPFALRLFWEVFNWFRAEDQVSKLFRWLAKTCESFADSVKLIYLKIHHILK